MESRSRQIAGWHVYAAAAIVSLAFCSLLATSQLQTPGSPLHLDVSPSLDGLEAAWWRRVIWIGSGTLFLVSVLLAVSHLLCLELRCRQRTEAALRDSESRFRLLAENSSDMVSRIGPDQLRRYVSPASIHLLGVPPEKLIGRRPQERIHPNDIASIEAAIVPLQRGETDQTTLSYRCQRVDGRWVWLEAAIKAVRDPVTGVSDGIVAITRDITERKCHEERLTQLATLDGLTCIANRRTFDEALEREWRRCVRIELPLSLLLIDIDRFKMLNDSQGHQRGDACLQQVAGLLRNTVRRASDLVARYGGEEFVLLLPETDAAGAEAVGERLRAEIEVSAFPHPSGGLNGVVTVSVGAATVWPTPDTPLGPADLALAADQCLYKAKCAGRNRVMHTMVPEFAGVRVRTLAEGNEGAGHRVP